MLLKYLSALCYKLISNRPHLVYYTIVPYGWSFYRDILFVAIIKLFRIKLVYHLHGKGALASYKKNKFLYDFAYNNVSVICLAEKLKQDIPFFKGNTFIVPNGIPVINFEPILKESLKDQTVRVLYLSNFIKSKGVLVLLESAKMLKKEQLKFKIQLIGQYRNEITKEFLEKYIHDNQLVDFVEIIGPTYGDDKVSYLKNADIFVFPTYYKNEAFPLVNLEAMQFSLPIISTDEGGISEMVENKETGFLVNQKDSEDLADKISQLILDNKLREKMGQKGRDRFLKNFTIEIFENNLMNVFKTILNQ